MFRQLIRRHRALARLRMLGHAQLHQRDQAAEVLIAGAVLDQYGT